MLIVPGLFYFSDSKEDAAVKKRFKIVIVGLLLLTCGVAGLSARDSLRLGLEFGEPLAVVIVRPAPLDFRIGYNFQEDNPTIFFSADYRIISGYHLVDILHMFLSLGAYTQLYLDDAAENTLDLGARIPVGLQVFLLKSALEFFVEVAPTVEFVPTIEPFKDFQGYIGFTIRLPS
jgi:hypothetical protein